MNNTITFKYPVVKLDVEQPDESVLLYREGEIRPIQLDHEPYEMSVNTYDHGFHLIFGSQINGNFLCIPNWQFGCELSRLDNKAWNMDALNWDESRIVPEDMPAIVWALAEVAELIS